jgi:glutathione S-transferase
MITLYDCATAPSPRRARIFLAEKGVSFETVQIDLRNAEQMGAAFRQINPQCTVPALRTEEGSLLSDNAAIAAYLEARYPEQRGLARALAFFAALNTQLQDREFIAAQQFSVADITAVVAVDFARVIRLRPDDRFPHLLRWRAAMAQRPSMNL